MLFRSEAVDGSGMFVRWINWIGGETQWTFRETLSCFQKVCLAGIHENFAGDIQRKTSGTIQNKHYYYAGMAHT